MAPAAGGKVGGQEQLPQTERGCGKLDALGGGLWGAHGACVARLVYGIG